eukprot:11180788-Ditylum_brightwellii.AAC.1
MAYPCSLSAKEDKNLNKLVKDKIDKTFKDCNHDIHAMRNFEDLSISSSDESIQSIVNDTSFEDFNNEDCKPATKK